MIAIDTSAIMSVLLNEPERVFVLQQTQLHTMIAATSLPFEIGNAASNLFKRKVLNPQEVGRIFHRFHEMEVRLVDVDFIKALEMANRFSIYAYDAYVLEIATRYRARLLTLDKSMKRHANTLNLEVIEP